MLRVEDLMPPQLEWIVESYNYYNCCTAEVGCRVDSEEFVVSATNKEKYGAVGALLQ